MDSMTPSSSQASDRFRSRLARADRILLALLICSMCYGLYAAYKRGFDMAFVDLFGDSALLAVFVALIVVPVLLVMAGANWHRRLAGAGLVVSSYVVGFGLWCGSVWVASVFAGTVATVIGIAAVGIGVIPVAIVGSLAHGEWLAAAVIVAATALVVVTRRFGSRWALCS